MGVRTAVVALFPFATPSLSATWDDMFDNILIAKPRRMHCGFCAHARSSASDCRRAFNADPTPCHVRLADEIVCICPPALKTVISTFRPACGVRDTGADASSRHVFPVGKTPGCRNSRRSHLISSAKGRSLRFLMGDQISPRHRKKLVIPVGPLWTRAVRPRRRLHGNRARYRLFPSGKGPRGGGVRGHESRADRQRFDAALFHRRQ